ncbi:MAG: MBL fold metallo-hydrolase [Thermoplasmatota archaeon]
MPALRRVSARVFIVAGPGITDPRDCLVYLVACRRELVLIDCGAGPSVPAILGNVGAAAPGGVVRALVITHGHIDHAGGAAEVKERTGCSIIAHELDMDAIEGRNPAKSAGSWYGMELRPARVDDVLTGREELRRFGDVELHLLHAPGHTPGSIVVYTDIEGKRVLFGQDIHGPFDPDFGSDVGAWRGSMRALLALNADVLCEGHFGVFEGRESARSFIESYLDNI